MTANFIENGKIIQYIMQNLHDFYVKFAY